jgi:hypothetical protein
VVLSGVPIQCELLEAVRGGGLERVGLADRDALGVAVDGGAGGHHHAGVRPAGGFEHRQPRGRVDLVCPDRLLDRLGDADDRGLVEDDVYVRHRRFEGVGVPDVAVDHVDVAREVVARARREVVEDANVVRPDERVDEVTSDEPTTPSDETA